ncbi:MAG: DHH family phosphoesterase [Planctomycetota bacterium]|nr:DHH family phosphoesterase [Planctomycetota bacterium]MEC8653272.1 DHH family phosphoesterase [Planctomycetota bacterium]MEC9048734.1 DHH family phosphoesterase [Planctomycetota bacterium]
MTTLPDLLRSQSSFLLTGHENPDGDCVGAQAALSHLLRALGKSVSIVNPDPISTSFDFLLEHTAFDSYRAGEALPSFDVAILMDCSQLSRVGALGRQLASSGKQIAVIDHHVGSAEGDGSVCYVDVTAAATGALVRRLFGELGVPLTKEAAEGVFLSLVADTGWFRYSNADQEVFAMASELVALGVEPAKIYDTIHRRNHADSPGILADALGRHRLLCGGRLAMVTLNKALVDRGAKAEFDTDAVLEPLRSIEGVEVVALLKERFDGTVKCSLRARGDVDVQAIVSLFGGGGHKKAAGATMRMSLAEAERALIQSIEQAMPAAGHRGES